MLSDHERRALGDVERRTAAEDPDFVNALRDGQEQLPRPGVAAEHPLLAPLAVVVIILLLMGQLTTAVIVASLAVGIGWLAGRYSTGRARR